MSAYRENENLPFTKLPFWIRNGRFLVVSVFATIVLGVSGGWAYGCAKRPRPIVEERCQDMSEIRHSNQNEMKCSPDAQMELYWGGAISTDHYLVVCRCRR